MIEDLDRRLDQMGTWGPELRRMLDRKVELQSELDNALEAAQVHAKADAPAHNPPKNHVDRESANLVPFAHSEDYRSVTVRGRRYKLTSRQAQMVEMLHAAYKNGTPDISIASILEKLEANSSRWQDTFKSNIDSRKALITTGERKGTLRLNL